MNTSASAERKSNENWWREWFNALYLDVYSHRDDESAADEVKTTLAALPLHPGHRILDLCCGNGRHSRSLIQSGYGRVTSIDYSMPLLRFAAAQKPVSSYIRGDMRMIPARDESFDAAVSFFTSFGYFKTNVENLGVLHELSRVLKSGGWFLFDYLNTAHVRKHFVAESSRVHEDYRIEERRWFSDDGERVEKEIAIKNWGDNERTYHESVRLYSYGEMNDMMKSADLYTLGVLGDFDGRAFGENAPRMILYGTRK